MIRRAWRLQRAWMVALARWARVPGYVREELRDRLRYDLECAPCETEALEAMADVLDELERSCEAHAWGERLGRRLRRFLLRQP